jgi:hypothetical protein
MQRKAGLAGLCLAGALAMAWLSGAHGLAGASPQLDEPVVAGQATNIPAATSSAGTAIQSMRAEASAWVMAGIATALPAKLALNVPDHSSEPTRVSDPSPAEAASGPATVLAINGLPLGQVVAMDEPVRLHVREVLAQGRALGRDPRSLAKVGDSTMAYPPLLAAFADDQAYKLGDYGYLQATITYFSASLAKQSPAVHKGMHTWSEFDPDWAPSDLCAAGEAPLACELRLENPAVAIIRLGANDGYAPAAFEDYLHRIVETCLAQGIVPVLGSKPDHTDGPGNPINKIIAQTAASYKLPLWDYDLVAGTLPGRGLESDNLHIVGSGSHDYTSPDTLKSASAVEDLTALLALDAVRQEIQPLTP